MMATVQCPKCTAERKGFRRELDSWRHKLIRCVGFETILEGIYGPVLLRELSVFDDCEPEVVDDWSPEASCSQCSFCNLPLDKLSDLVPAPSSPLSSPSDYSPPSIAESSQSAHRFLQDVFHKKDVSLGCDSNIPPVAEELMKKMIHQFARDYASKYLPHTSTNGVTTTTSLPLSETSDAGPLDLTVSRNQEEKESDPEPADGVLDLSNRNSACSATSSSSSSSNHKATGSLLPSFKEELGDLGPRGNKCRQSSVLNAVLSSLCPAHRSLLYKILKLAHQEKLLPLLNHRPSGQNESYCCHCVVKPQDNVTPRVVTISECKAHNSNPYYSLMECDHQGHGSTVHHAGDSKANRSIQLYPINDCKSEGSRGSSCCCMQRCRMETYTVLCPKRLHCISCQSLAVGHINNIVCPFTSSPPLSTSPSLCTPSPSLYPSSSICCNQHTPHSCPCYSNHACLVQVRNTIERGVIDGDPPCPVLKREQSPSPPPLSPIPADACKKIDEKPPSLLHHRQEGETDPTVKNGPMNSSHEANMDTAVEELHCRTHTNSQTEQNPSGTSLQDVVNRFSEKLETIKPPVSSAINVSEKDQLQSPSTSQNLQCQDDAHLTEIITKVLHKGSGSDYNLSELFNRHESKEPKSPKTRLQRRQEVRAAIATPADDPSTRRQTLQIKREFARLDPSCNRRRGPPGKRARLNDGKLTVTTSHTSADFNLVKGKLNNEMEADVKPVENHRVGEGAVNTLPVQINKDDIKDEIETVIITEDIHVLKEEEKEREMSDKEKDLTFSGSQTPTPEVQSKYSKQGSIGHSIKTQTQVMVTSTEKCGRQRTADGKVSVGGDNNHEKAPSGQSSDGDNRTGNRPGKVKDFQSPIRKKQKTQSNHSKESRRSRRSIVPPQRFSSYVTEPRKMFFVACFNESIFNQGARKDKAFTSSTLNSVSKDPDAKDIQLESSNEASLSSPEHKGKLASESTQGEQFGSSETEVKTRAAKEKSPARHSSDITTDGSDCATKPLGRLRPSPKRLEISASRTAKHSNSNATTDSVSSIEKPPNSLVQYTSPIKLMFVSPVKDEEGVRYSLKSAGSGPNAQAEESFDPCEESSWAGTPEKPKNQNTESPTSKGKSIASPLKSATSLTSSACSPTKSAISPAKSASSPVKSASSPPKSGASPVKSASSPPKSGASPVKSASSPPKSGALPVKSASSTPKSGSSSVKSASSTPKSSPVKSPSSTPKSSPSKAVSSPRKSAASPCKSASSSRSSSSPKSTSSSPKIGSRRSSERTPTKRAAGTENQRSPCDLASFHESTPPKRRPGRPKKLGPQLEQKVKRPIGRPRKQNIVDSVSGAKTVSGKSLSASDSEENVNKNLKITVVYGRSRRNKRMVSEGFDQLQTEFHDAWQAVGLNGDLGILMHNSKTTSGSSDAPSTELSEEFSFVSPVKESAPQSSSNIKCQKRDDSVRSRKPGRPAKVKISGISVTVTTVSPRQRKIQINKDTRQSPETLTQKQACLPEFKSAKEPRTISHHATNKSSQTEKGEETMDASKDKRPNQTVAVRHSMRVRKPSIYFLHAVATSTSRSYSHSNALLRRSKQLLLNKANNERRKEEQQSSVETSGEKRQPSGQDKRKNISQDLSRVAGVSVDSIFTSKETLRWWAASAEEKTMNQELARRIRVISDTWVSNGVESPEKEIAFNSKLGTKGNNSIRKSKHSSVVRSLFDCSPNKPRSCSMQQLCSWFMQTTETQSLAIVKKASSRNPYELMHFPRSVNKKTVCHSPQAERLRKHIKKFAKTVPKSPLQHQQAQRRLRKRNKARLATGNARRRLFAPKISKDRFDRGVQWCSNRAFKTYQATLLRATIRFLTRKEREMWQKRQRNKKSIKSATNCSNGHTVTGLQPNHKALNRSVRDQLSDCLENISATSSVDQTQEPVDGLKEQNLCSKAWSPKALKECRVFLRKINSPDNESTEEEWDSCTVTLDDGSPSAYVYAERARELVGVVKAVKTERKRSMNRRNSTRGLTDSAPKSMQEQDEMPSRRRKNKYKSPGVVSTEPPQPPPAKTLRQSRMRGLTGPRWCDFVFEK